MAGRELNIGRQELAELVDQVVDPDATTPFGLYLFASDEPGADLARHVESAVFGEVFGNSPELLADQYDAFEPASFFLCVIDHQRKVPAGMIRVILPSSAGLKSLDDIEQVWEQPVPEVLEQTGMGFNRDRAWDVCTMAVAPEYRGDKTGRLVSLALMQGVSNAAWTSDVEWWVTVLDVVVLELVQKAIGRPFSYFRGVEPLSYLDSPSSVPVWANISEWKSRVAFTEVDTYEALAQGSALEEAVARPNWDRLPRLLETISSLVGAPR